MSAETETQNPAEPQTPVVYAVIVLSRMERGKLSLRGETGANLKDALREAGFQPGQLVKIELANPDEME